MKQIAAMLGLACVGWLAFVPSTALAQATRTWVSGVGDDVNPCSRTAPCKTFAGAISKTAAGGIINCIDPGGFGAITITKSITLDCGGTFGGILVAGTNAINVNGAGVIVNLRNLDIEGVAGLIGISFTQGNELNIENCKIFGFTAGTAAGIVFAPNTAAKLNVVDSIVNDNGGGIDIVPNSGSSAKVSLLRTTMNGNTNFGLKADTTAGSGAINIGVTDSQASNGGHMGINLLSGAAPVVAMLDRVAIVGNATNGIQSNQTAGSTATAMVGFSVITANGKAGNSVGGGSVQTYGNNLIDGNTDNTAFTPVPGGLK